MIILELILSTNGETGRKVRYTATKTITDWPKELKPIPMPGDNINIKGIEVNVKHRTYNLDNKVIKITAYYSFALINTFLSFPEVKTDPRVDPRFIIGLYTDDWVFKEPELVQKARKTLEDLDIAAKALIKE